jgi:hypothetical protein
MTIGIEELADRPPLPEGTMSFEEFVERCPENVHAEWVDGRAILLHVTVAERHDFIVKFLTTLFNLLLNFGRLGVVHGEPFLMLYESAVLPGLRLRVEWLWQERRPEMDEVLGLLGER